jgi:salicylate hydroxylase
MVASSLPNQLYHIAGKHTARRIYISTERTYRVLVSRARELGVRIVLRSRVTGIDFEGPAVKLANGTVFKANLVIGADGLKSVCREALLGRKDPPRLTGDLAYRITVPATKMREKECLRELVDSPSINCWLDPDSHVVGYLIKVGDLYNMVLACPDNLPELVNTAKADLGEMREIFSNWDPRLQALLEMVQETSKWRLMNSEEMAHWGHEGGKFVLLGDACHATLPYLYCPSPSSQAQADTKTEPPEQLWQSKTASFSDNSSPALQPQARQIPFSSPIS